MSYRDQIELELTDLLLKRLVERGGEFERLWLDSSSYSFDFDDTFVGGDLEDFKCGEAVLSDRIISYTDEQLLELIDRQCIKIEEHMHSVLKKVSVGKVSYRESKASINIKYRFFEIIFRYNFLEW